ncbi:hypothetical protein [Alkalicoccus halolimnae]|uniref:Uncharacterized protein n=1 Tax=Alkalicoccus halolimnae TaxID=1667239 RepID=A0A5C7FN28_9BACI|nr:hypothetical protein [Alkalicoccus halolimnae]TXF87409.1 hypothetical protein FTX54_01435 [Alkalicoccus halolimnae]
MKLKLGTKESLRREHAFHPNIILFWLRHRLYLSDRRFMGFKRNTLFWVFPMGKQEITYPVRNLVSVNVYTKFYFFRFVIGCFLLFASLILLESALTNAFIVLGLALFPLLHCFVSRLEVSPSNGDRQIIDVNILERQELQNFANEVNIVIAEYE